MENINSKDIIVYDLETTGLDERCDEILQLSIIDGDGDVLYNSYFKPEHVKEWARAEQSNHISPEMVKDKPFLKDEIDKILNIFKQAKLIVGYNQKGYDNKFLIHANSDFKTIFQSTPQRDVMLMYAEYNGDWSDYFNNYKWHRLEDASKELQYVNTDQFHNSLEDCKATLWVYNHLKDIDG